MTDIASLGIEIRSEQAIKVAADLDKLSGAAKRAETATRSLSGGAKATSAANAAVSTSATSAAAALTNEAAAATKAAAAMRSHTAAVNDNARRMGGSMSGLAAQFQDIGVTASMGMNPAIIALQQGTQIAGQMEMAMQSGASATSVLGTAFKSLFSPLTFITIAMTALAAAGLQMVDWTALASSALNGLAWAIDNLSPYILGAAATLALIYAPAILSGLAAVTVAVATLGATALRAAASFTLAWLAAIGPAGWFILGLAAITTAAIVFRDELTRIFGVDIVGAAKTGINTVIAVFHGGYEGIVAAWDQLPAAFQDLAARAGWLLADTLRYWINEAILLVDSFIGTVNEKMGTSIGRLSTLAPLKGPKSTGAAGNVGDIISGAISKRMGTDYLGEFGTAIANGASAAADKLRELAGSFGSVEEAAGKAGRGAKEALDKSKDAAEQMANKMRDAANGLGQSFGGIFRGLIDKTMDWKDAALSAVKSVLQYLNQVNVSQGGKGLFGGGLLQGLIGGLLGIGFQSGGYTGAGAASQPAGIVHAGEYVMSKSAVDRLGVGYLDALHNAAKGYQMGGYVRSHAPANLNLRGYQSGGYVHRPAAGQEVIKIELVSRFDADGGFEQAVERSSRPVAMQESAKAAGQVARAVPSMALGAMDDSRTRRRRTISPGGVI